VTVIMWTSKLVYSIASLLCSPFSPP